MNDICGIFISCFRVTLPWDQCTAQRVRRVQVPRVEMRITALVIQINPGEDPNLASRLSWPVETDASRKSGFAREVRRPSSLPRTVLIGCSGVETIRAQVLKMRI